MSCHLDHEIYELFDKRNFRCDCATPKSVVHLCTLNQKIHTMNTSNQYNHNFRGLYCWCSSHYDHNSDVTMIQCYMCQDWYHDTCILKNYPYNIPEEPDTDFICKDCILKYHSFLGKYSHLEYIDKDETENPVNITIQEKPVSQNYLEKEECCIASKESGRIGNFFFSPGWRDHLCRCSRCITMYQLINVSYLIQDEENKHTISSSTESVKKPAPEANAIPEQKQREIAFGFMDFRDNLMEFLKPFALQKRTVTAADIEVFKEQFQKKKKKI